MTNPADGRYGPSLQGFLATLDARFMIYRKELRNGDLILVRTCNSNYTIRVLGAERFSVSGGWFDRRGIAPLPVTIAGCTWGGSVIKVDVIVACGLCIEFGNRVRTSMVRSIAVLGGEVPN